MLFVESKLRLDNSRYELTETGKCWSSTSSRLSKHYNKLTGHYLYSTEAKLEVGGYIFVWDTLKKELSSSKNKRHKEKIFGITWLVAYQPVSKFYIRD